jgi:hypothetical protein
MEIFHVSGLKGAQYLVAKEDFGSFKRTLDAYLAAYHCQDVDWEINWKTRFAPEFRLLPGKRGSYSPLQLLAVLRALRYNDYFTSLSFRDIDLSVLHGIQDNTPRKVNVAYLSRTCKLLVLLFAKPFVCCADPSQAWPLALTRSRRCGSAQCCTKSSTLSRSVPRRFGRSTLGTAAGPFLRGWRSKMSRPGRCSFSPPF